MDLYKHSNRVKPLSKQFLLLYSAHYQSRVNCGPNAENLRGKALVKQGNKRNCAFFKKYRDKKAQPMAILAKSCASLF